MMNRIRTENRRANAWRKVVVMSAIVLFGANLCKAQNDNWADAVNRDTDWPRAFDMDGEDFGGSSTLYVSTASELAQFAWMVNSGAEDFIGKTVLLLDNIDLSAFWWTPVGGNPTKGGLGGDPNIYFHNAFQGTFDGMDCTISGLRFSPDHVAEPQVVMGLFGLVVGNVNNNGGGGMVGIRNLRLKVEEFESDSGFAGAVAGCIHHVEVLNVSVSGVPGAVLRHGFVKDVEAIKVSHDVPLFAANTSAAGGLFGYAGVCLFENCTNALPVTVEVREDDWDSYTLLSVGGIAGYAADTEAYDCFNSGGVTVTYELLGSEAGNFFPNIGGLFGVAENNVMVSGFVNYGAVEAQDLGIANIGGVVGYSGLAGNATLGDCHNRAAITVITDYLGAGAIAVGGIVGEMSSTSAQDCSNAGDISVQGGAIAGGIAGTTWTVQAVNCWNSGDVQVTQTGAYRTETGGLAGDFGPNSTFVNSYNSGTVNAQGGVILCYSGALVGTIANASLSACYWSDDAGAPFGRTIGGESVFNCATFDAAPGATLTAYDSSGIYGGNASIDLLTVLNAYVLAQSPGTPQQWTLDDSVERGAKGYPAFGPYALPPFEGWVVGNDPTYGEVLYNHEGWMFTVNLLKYPDPFQDIEVISCVATPPIPTVLDFSGPIVRESDLQPIYFIKAIGGGGGSVLAGYENDATGLVLPETLQFIGVNAFMNSSGLTGSLVIPDGVTQISSGAFRFCSFNDELTLGDPIASALTGIGAFAFDGNSFIGSLTIPDSVEGIGDYAFVNNAFNGTLTLETSASALTDIGDHAFANNQFARSLTIPDSVVTIGEYAFWNNRFGGITYFGQVPETLTLETVQSSLTTIGDYAFADNEFEGDLVIPDSVEDIGDYAFVNNAFDGTLALGTSASSLTGIGNYAFANNQFMGGLTIPNSVVTIGEYAFADNVFTGGLTLGANVETIGAYAFEGNPFEFRMPLSIPDSVTFVGYGAFSGNIFSYVSSWGTLDTIFDGMFDHTRFMNTLVIPMQITSIGEYAFYDAELADIVVCDGVTNIGERAFHYASFSKISLPSTGVSFGDYALWGAPHQAWSVYFRGGYPDVIVTENMYSWSSDVVTYVRPAFTNEWNGYVVNAPITGSIYDAEWYEYPIVCEDWDWDQWHLEHLVKLDFSNLPPGGLSFVTLEPPTEQITVKYGDPVPDIVPPGGSSLYAFLAYTNTAGKVYYDTTGSGGTLWDKHGGDTLYAAWGAKTLPGNIVYFFGNGGNPPLQTEDVSLFVPAPPAPASYRFSATATWPNDDYVFLNWNTEPDGSGESYDGGMWGSLPIDTVFPITLFAQWTKGDPGESETWVHVDVIRVSLGGDVDLEWAFADVQTRLGVTTGSEFHYVIEVCTDLSLMDWVPCLSADLTRLGGMERHRLTNGAMPGSDKRFFKVKAVKD
ncbi:MAG: leucine-rich repeat domain-containing protein [Kiritimatiellaeota bacterium]|nr:leucine-rich repeat domain-containing protein [Kiritimatiellota bacterium]